MLKEGNQQMLIFFASIIIFFVILLIFVYLKSQKREKNLKLRTAELEKFKLAVDHASDHIVITDANGIVVYANKAVANITGYAIKEVLGQKVGTNKLWGGLMDKIVYEDMWNVIKKQKKPFIGGIQNKRKDGRIYDAAVSISPIFDEHKNVQFFVGIERDITKEKEIDRAKSEFISLASHKLRTPLAAINWFVEMLLSGDAGKLTDEQIDYIQEINKGNHRMVDLVNALLNVSRIDMGTLAVDPQPTNLAKVAEDTIKDYNEIIKAKNLNIKTSFDNRLTDVKVDPKLIKALFQNLISNACNYSPTQAEVVVSIQFVKKGTLLNKKKLKKDFVYIKISDTGYGIPKHQQEKIFSKLFRADNVREKDTEGTGVGLYIVKYIVDSSNGEIWFNSRENKGTVFNVLLPYTGMIKKVGTKSLI